MVSIGSLLEYKLPECWVLEEQMEIQTESDNQLGSFSKYITILNSFLKSIVIVKQVEFCGFQNVHC